MARSTGNVSPEVRRRELSLTRIAKIRATISKVEYVCSGTLSHRTKTCGRSSCQCHVDAEARHGPYFEWTRLQGGKLVHRTVSDQQARAMLAAIANFRQVRALLRRWERETLRAFGVRPTEKP